MRNLKFRPVLAVFSLALCVHAADPAPVDPYAQIAQFDFGQDRAALNVVDQSIREAAGDATKLARIEERLAGVLSTTGLKPGAQDYICRALSVIGTDKSVPALASLLKDDRAADAARLALERVPAAAAGDALRAALSGSSGRARLGVIRSLGVRKESTSVRTLVPLLADPDAATVAAAAGALGLIANEAALDALLKCGRLDVPAVADAALLCADRAAGHDAKRAAKAYRAVMASPVYTVSEAATIGLAKVQPSEVSRILVESLGSADEKVVSRAIRLASGIRPAGFAKPAAARLADFKPAVQIPLLAILGEVGDVDARPAVLRETQSPDEAVRIAAIDALGSLPGDRASINALADLMGDTAKPIAQAATRALTRVNGSGVENIILAGVGSGSTKRRCAFIAALGDRQTEGAEKALLALRADADPEIRRAALKALDKVAGPEAHAGLIAWMLDASDASESREAEGLVGRLGARAPKAVEELLASEAKASAAQRAMLARCLAKRGGDAALKQVRADLASGDAALELEAVKALANWPDAGPLDDLLAQAGASDARRAGLAAQGVLRLLALAKERSIEQKAAVCVSLAEKSSLPDVRKAVLSSLTDYPCAASLALARTLEADTACAAEAKAAVARLTLALAQPTTLTASHNGGEAGKAMDGNPATRWTTGAAMAPGMWLMLDLHQACAVRRIVLDAGASANDYPRGYSVRGGAASDALGEPVLAGQGKGAMTEFKFDPPLKARFVRIEQTGRADAWFWSVHELKVEAEPVVAP